MVDASRDPNHNAHEKEATQPTRGKPASQPVDQNARILSIYDETLTPMERANLKALWGSEELSREVFVFRMQTAIQLMDPLLDPGLSSDTLADATQLLSQVFRVQSRLLSAIEP